MVRCYKGFANCFQIFSTEQEHKIAENTESGWRICIGSLLFWSRTKIFYHEQLHLRDFIH